MITSEWKWSNGQENVRTLRKRMTNLVKESENEIYTNTNTNTSNTNTSVNDATCQNVINQSLEGYDSFGFEPFFSRNDNEMGKIREDLDNKISNRELIFQRGTNPFLQSSNYINDVVASDAFLKPKNTTFDKIKQSEEQ